MIDNKICDWLMDNADVPIRYRVARELLKDEKYAAKIESELFEHKEVQKWMKLLKPELPVKYSLGYMEHGSFDFCFENALLKLVQLGLHGNFEQITNAVGYYTSHNKFDGIAMANLFLMANINNEAASKHILGRLDKMYNFTKQGIYDIYISEEEKKKLTGIPKNWKNKNFIRPELFKDGYSYPLIYDILGLHRLYNIKNLEIDEKINGVIDYISTDKFHAKIQDGYGILISGRYASGNPQYHGMGWDPKYPGWFEIQDYMENINAPKLLFFAQNILKYPPAKKTKWFSDLINYLDKYKLDSGNHIFPKDWLKESQGYAVQGHHISFGENRRKKIWLEIESTFYMQLLQQND